VPGSDNRLPAKLRLVLAGYVGIACGFFAGVLACVAAAVVVFFGAYVYDYDYDYVSNLDEALVILVLGSLIPFGLLAADSALEALKTGNRFSGLLRRPSDPRTATVTASTRGGRTLVLDTTPGGYQPLSEVRLALWLKADMLMPGERVTVYGWPDRKEPLLVSSAQRGRVFLGTVTSRSTVPSGPLDEKVSGATLVDWAAWAASTTFSSTGLKSGYDMEEVDAFRSAVRDTFLGGAVFSVSTPPLRSDEVRGKQFSTHRRGYDKTQVDAFLEAAGIRLAAMESADRPVGPLVSGAILAGWADWADSTKFSAGGYTATEVDAFQEAVRDTFLGKSQPPVTADDVRGRQFPSAGEGTAGYDKTQVDAFLDAAGIRLAAMEATDGLEDSGAPRLVIHQVEGLPEEVSRPATRDIQSRQESKKSGRWMIGIGLALTALSIAGPIIASNIASENSGDNSNTSPSPSSSIPGPPEDYKELLSRLPASERSTCRDASSLVSSQLAEAHCSSGWYSLWKTNADGRDWVLASDMKRGDCLHNSLGRKSAYQHWSKNGLSGLLTCFHASDDVCLVEWSIKSLRITGTFRGDDGCYDYKELISKAVRVRDAVK
jgi:DivIVA domain-containing protein